MQIQSLINIDTIVKFPHKEIPVCVTFASVFAARPIVDFRFEEISLWYKCNSKFCDSLTVITFIR